MDECMALAIVTLAELTLCMTTLIIQNKNSKVKIQQNGLNRSNVKAPAFVLRAKERI